MAPKKHVSRKAKPTKQKRAEPQGALHTKTLWDAARWFLLELHQFEMMPHLVESSTIRVVRKFAALVAASMGANTGKLTGSQRATMVPAVDGLTKLYEAYGEGRITFKELRANVGRLGIESNASGACKGNKRLTVDKLAGKSEAVLLKEWKTERGPQGVAFERLGIVYGNACKETIEKTYRRYQQMPRPEEPDSLLPGSTDDFKCKILVNFLGINPDISDAALHLLRTLNMRYNLEQAMENPVTAKRPKSADAVIARFKEQEEAQARGKVISLRPRTETHPSEA